MVLVVHTCEKMLYQSQFNTSSSFENFWISSIALRQMKCHIEIVVI